MGVEPTSFRAGDTVTWTRTEPDYPASAWTLSYVLVNSSAKISFDATASGDDHVAARTAAQTATYTAGIYKWVSRVTDGTTVTTIDHGTVEILADLIAGAAADQRSHAKIMLDAIESLLQGKASKDVSSYSVAGRALTKLTPDEIEMWRDKYRAEYAAERRKERIRDGRGSGATVKVRFV